MFRPVVHLESTKTGVRVEARVAVEREDDGDRMLEGPRPREITV